MRLSEWSKRVIERDGRCRECGGTSLLTASGIGTEGYVICRVCRQRAKDEKRVRGGSRVSRRYEPKGELSGWKRKTLERKYLEAMARIGELENG